MLNATRRAARHSLEPLALRLGPRRGPVGPMSHKDPQRARTPCPTRHCHPGTGMPAPTPRDHPAIRVRSTGWLPHEGYGALADVAGPSRPGREGLASTGRPTVADTNPAHCVKPHAVTVAFSGRGGARSGTTRREGSLRLAGSWSTKQSVKLTVNPAQHTIKAKANY